MTSSALGASDALAREPEPTRAAIASWAPRLQPWIVPLLFLLFWEIAARTGIANPKFLPTLEAIAVRGVKEFSQDGLTSDLTASLGRDLLGFVVGASIGLTLGLALGFSRLIERLLSPLLLAHRQIALFAWVPLISMWFGGGETGKVVFIALAAFQPALINTWQGVAGIPKMYRELSRVLTFNGWDFAILIALPGALPRIFTGLHAALIYAWTSTVGAELLLDIAPGIGGRMNEGQHLFHIDLLFLCVFLLGGLGVIFNLFASALERRLIRGRHL